MDKDYENYNPYELASLLASQQALAQGVQQLAMRPQKSSQTTTTTSTSTPRALADLIKTRDTIGGATTDLASALRGRENWGYALGNILSGIQADSTPGGWLAGLARGAGAGLTTMENIRQDTAKQLYDARMQDLAQRLAYDKAMGEMQTQNQSQTIKYENMPWSSGGKGTGTTEQTKPAVYDVSPAPLPDVVPSWGEFELKSEQLRDPNTQTRTMGGLTSKWISEKTNPTGRPAMMANQNAYVGTFTVPKVTELAKQTGGSRGIDTIPEINIKGGPELSASNMDSKTFAKAVQDQAWQIADQIVKANPNATITREELANAFINNFNHSVQPEYRVVGYVSGSPKPTAASPAKTIAQSVSKTTPSYDYSKYGF